MSGVRTTHYLQIQAVLLTSQPHAFLYATETVQQWADPPFPALVMQYIQSWGLREWSGTRDYAHPCHELLKLNSLAALVLIVVL
jgi:hypothetical protein